MKYSAILLLLTIATTNTFSQSAVDSAKAINKRRVLNNIFEEKLRCNPKQAEEVLRKRIADEQARRASGSTIEPVIREEDEVILAATDVNKKVTVGNNQESEIHAALNPIDNNNMVCSANGINTSTGMYMPLYYTKDFGTTWRKSTYKPGPKNTGAFVLGGGDPMFAYDANGKLYFSWINLYSEGGFTELPMAMYWIHSSDGGATWNRNTTDDAVLMGNILVQDQLNSVVADKQWMMCDISDSPYKNNLYCSLLHTAPGEERIGVRIKPANATGFTDQTLRPKNKDYTFNQFTSIDVDDKGWVHASFVGSHETDKEFKQMEVWQMVSKDGGASFLPEVKVSNAYFLAQDPAGGVKPPTAPTGIARVQTLPQIACDKFTDSPYKGNVYCVWTAVGVSKDEGKGLDIYFSRSTNGGETWLPAVVVNDDKTSNQTATQAYPTIAVNKNGVIGIAWHDRREDPSDINADYYMTYSFDGGKTFIKNFAVTNAPTVYSTFTGQNEFGMGEYNQLLMTENFAVPFWGDGRSQAMRIYMAKVSISSNPELFPLGAEEITPVSDELSVQEAQPNPAVGNTQISFALAAPSDVEYILTDVQGNVIQRNTLGVQTEGTHTITVPLQQVASGSYFIRINTKFGYAVRKIVKAQ
ncbi:MAG: T9SS type A sorting domain-containing protein [Candidatus Kapaibacterium sp.]|nr:T9SS type A sorting domain-containing protein [Bacteroidota bacterium]